MAMMGRHSVEYHAQTLGLGTLADGAALEPGVEAEASAALRYYSSAGETPLVWGGSGASALGLSGAVTEAQYRAVYAEGGAVDPTTGARLVATARPGMELVVSAQKSVAELGVIGRVSDMHAILTAETDATLAYLDAVTRQTGGRRGRSRVPARTEGLIYVRTRHATSRAGDPSPHDHVLLANVVAMADEVGGFKAPDTTLWRDHLHAATMVGRMASAAVAVELGYGIEADPGPSGRLGHWRIAGVPREVEEIHSKRGAEISAALAESGFTSPRAKEVAANETRPAKRHTPVSDLVQRWHAELEDAGYPVAQLTGLVDEAARTRQVEPLSWERTEALIAEALGPEGALGRRKVFSRPDAVVALAPALYGQAPEKLDEMVAWLVSDPDVIAMIGVPGQRQQAYTTAATLATEAAIAAAVEAQMAYSDRAIVPVGHVSAAVAAVEDELGAVLTPGQRSLVHAATGSGRGAELVVGVAGAGKTTALAVVRAAYESAGYSVVGVATPGQAARTLKREAGIGDSRTLASLTWRLDHGRLSLTDRHVVILDEVGITDDPALLRLLAATQQAGAKLVMVGDWRQLGPVGPGGAFEALLRRHQGRVTVLSENVRQRDRTEAEVLLALRSGSVTDALDFYAAHGRIRVGPTRSDAIESAVEAWAEDLAQGRDSALLAWRRVNVAELNVRARAHMTAAGHLCGPELSVTPARRYQAGDRVVALAPTADGELATSQRASVVAVDLEAKALTLRTEEGRLLSLAGDEIGPDRLDHAYATTVHRAQGATLDAAHLLADGGGRELAYVAMSRARGASHVYVVADDADQARDDLAREWSLARRPRWALDVGTPGEMPEPSGTPARNPARVLALRYAQLADQLEAVTAAAPPALGAELAAATQSLAALEARRADLTAGAGPYRDTPIGVAHAQLGADGERSRSIEGALARAPGFFARRRLHGARDQAKAALEASRDRLEVLVGPERRRLDAEIETLRPRLVKLKARSLAERDWLAAHPEAGPRARRISASMAELRRNIDHRGLGLEDTEPRLYGAAGILAGPAPPSRQREIGPPERRRGLGRSR